jgi:hypothetical protein
MPTSQRISIVGFYTNYHKKGKMIGLHLITCFSMLVPPTTMAVFNDSRDLLKAWTCQKVKQHKVTVRNPRRMTTKGAIHRKEKKIDRTKCIEVNHNCRFNKKTY